MKKPIYKPEKCECCGQSKTYLLAIDPGTIKIVRAVARAIHMKGVNVIHANKELVAEGYLTANERSNMSRPRSHGLVAQVKGKGMAGNYCLTRKGADFLRGARIPQYAIMSKVEKKQIGYLEAEKYSVTMAEVMQGEQYWESINYTIEDGRIVTDPVDIER